LVVTTIETAIGSILNHQPNYVALRWSAGGLWLI